MSFVRRVIARVQQSVHPEAETYETRIARGADPHPGTPDQHHAVADQRRGYGAIGL